MIRILAAALILPLAGCGALTTMQGQVQGFTASDIHAAAATADAAGDGLGKTCFGSLDKGLATGGAVGVATALEGARICQGIIPTGLIP